MGFRLLPNSVILDDFERRNSPTRSVHVISPYLVALMVSSCDAWYSVYSKHCVVYVIVCTRIYVRSSLLYFVHYV